MTIKRKAVAPPPEILARMASMLRKRERPQGDDALSADILASGVRHIDSLVAKAREIEKTGRFYALMAAAMKVAATKGRTRSLPEQKPVRRSRRDVHYGNDHHYKKTA